MLNLKDPRPVPSWTIICRRRTPGRVRFTSIFKLESFNFKEPECSGAHPSAREFERPGEETHAQSKLFAKVFILRQTREELERWSGEAEIRLQK